VPHEPLWFVLPWARSIEGMNVSNEQLGIPPPGSTRVIAIANQKGGVGKSTTAVSLGAALAEVGQTVLVVDLDPQGNASTGMGIRHEAREVSIYEVLAAEASIREAVVHTLVRGLDAVPSTIDLAGAEIELVSLFSRESRLAKALEPVCQGEYQFVLLDCPPSLGLLTVNALVAAEELLIPIQCEYYALEGLGQLLHNVGLVQQNVNPGLRLTGIVMTMFDSRTRLAEQVVAEVRRYFGATVYDTIIPRTVRLSEAPGYGEPITVYDPRSRGAECYRSLAAEVLMRAVPEGGERIAAQGIPVMSPPPARPDRPEPEVEVAADVQPKVEELAPMPAEPDSAEPEPVVEASTPVDDPPAAVVPTLPGQPQAEVKVETSPASEPAPDRAARAEIHDVAVEADASDARVTSPVTSEDAGEHEVDDRTDDNQESRRRWRLFRKGGEA
jgi:chromosome partitioning protein